METSINLNVRDFIPLSLLHASSDYSIEGRTRFQKLVFIVQQRLEDSSINRYDFIKYDYGPFAKEILDDLERLERAGLVEIDEQRTFGGNKRYDHSLTSEGIETVEQAIEQDEQISYIYDVSYSVVNDFNDMSIRQLLEDIYDKYPEYKENSVYTH